jgi:LuxR family quorum-sensing transcriptional regulator LasR
MTHDSRCMDTNMTTTAPLTAPKTPSAANSDTLDAWRDKLFQFGAGLGFRYTCLAIFPAHDTLIECANGYLHSNLPQVYLRRYDSEKYGEIDPVILHCMVRSSPLSWSPESFVEERQRRLYADMCEIGVQYGVAAPYHGPWGEFGMLWLGGRTDSSELAPGMLAELSYFRDVAMDAFSGFMRKGYPVKRQGIELTSRELECLQWCAAGKSSWDISHLMNCTEATVNYHFANIRRKFGASSRRMAVIKAIQLGFLSV